MAKFSVLQDLSVELRRQIFEALESTPDTDFGLSGSVDRITLRPPSDGLAQNVVGSLYLYRLEINPNLRNQPFLPDRTSDDQYHRPPLPLQLRYLFTPLDDDEGLNQLLLGRVLQHFNDFPSFSTLSGEPIGDAFGGASTEIRVTSDVLTLEQLGQLWNAFARPYRVGLPLLVEVVAIDSGQPPVRRGRISEVLVAVGKEG